MSWLCWWRVLELEEYIIGPANELSGENQDTNSRIVDQIKIHGPEEGQSWIAKPIATGRSTIWASRQGSLLGTSVPLVDPLVTLFSSVHEKDLENSSTGGSMLFLFKEHDQWDVENQEETQQKYRLVLIFIKTSRFSLVFFKMP